MLNKSAIQLVKLLEKNHSIPQEEQPIYIYGFELLISTVLSMTSIFLISILINKIIYDVSFLLFFFLLRLFCGGYHAKTYLKCFITTNTIFVLTIILTNLFLLFRFDWIMPIIVTISTVIVFLFSPIKNKNHPYSEKTYIKNKRCSQFISLSFIFIFIYIFYFTSFEEIVVHSAWSFTFVSIMIIIEKLRLIGGENREYCQFNDC